jgi:hypothetical protein
MWRFAGQAAAGVVAARASSADGRSRPLRCGLRRVAWSEVRGRCQGRRREIYALKRLTSSWAGQTLPGAGRGV